MINHGKFLKVLTHPTLGVTKGVKLLSHLGKKKSKNIKEYPAIQRIKYNGNNLLILRNPSEKTLKFLKRNYRYFHPVHLEDIISTVQRPKIDEEKDYIFSVFHFPQYNETTNKIESMEVDFFLTQNDLTVVIDPEFITMEEIIEKIIKNKTKKQKFFEAGPGILLYHILDDLVDSIFPLLDDFDQGLETIDQNVFSTDPKNIAEQLSFLRRNVIFFQSLIKPELNSFIKIEESRHPFINRELKTYFSNITDHLKKIWDRLEDLIELSNNLSQTFESYLTFKTNETIKILTMFSVVLLPLTLLSGIYGMNLQVLPLADHPYALVYISASMVAVVIVMLAYFRYKHWI